MEPATQAIILRDKNKNVAQQTSRDSQSVAHFQNRAGTVNEHLTEKKTAYQATLHNAVFARSRPGPAEQSCVADIWRKHKQYMKYAVKKIHQTN